MPKQTAFLHIHVSRKKERTFIDRAALAASFISPATGIPQAVNVFHGKTAGVSLATWGGFIIFAVLFLAYGLFHKVKPMVISNFLWLVVEVSVVAGVLINR